MGRKSKAKGAKYEHEIAKELSLWWSEEERDDIFWSTHSSGARATQRSKQGKNTAYQIGDLTCADPLGKPLLDVFVIECKRGYNKWDILELVDSPSNKWGEGSIVFEWNKIAMVAKENGKEPLLIFRRDYKESTVMIRFEMMERLECFCGKVEFERIIYNNQIAIFRFSDFLLWLPPIMIFEYIKYVNS